ncbi:MAG: hypothetical protein WAN35_01150 [Terracidiphilus sp.]
MNIQQVEIKLPDGYISDQVTRTYFQQPFGAAFASFDPQSLLVNCVPPAVKNISTEGSIEVDEYHQHLRKRISSAVSPEEQLQILLEDSAWSHEIQHFHDCVCTASGIHAFVDEWEYVSEIYGGLKSLRIKGWTGESALWIEGQDNPDVKAVFAIYCSMIIFHLMMNGDFPTLEVPEELADYDVAWGNGTVGGSKVRIPFFPSRVTVNGSPACLLIPIGFRAITECRSVQTQNMILRSLGQEYVTAFLKLLGPHLEYRVVNLLITRLAKKNGLNPHEGDWGDALFRVCGAALCKAWGAGLERTPGVALIDVLSELPADQVLNGSFLDQNLLLAKAASERFDFPPAPDSWAGYQIRDFAIDSFRRSIEIYESAGRDPFPPDSLSWYSVLGTTLPQPLASLQGVHVGFSFTAGETKVLRHLAIVSAWVLLRCLIEQVMFDNKIVCPTLEGPYSRLLQFMKIHPCCAKGVVEGGCGRFKIGDDLSMHPTCAFRHIVTDIGLAKGPFQP